MIRKTDGERWSLALREADGDVTRETGGEYFRFQVLAFAQPCVEILVLALMEIEMPRLVPRTKGKICEVAESRPSGAQVHDPRRATRRRRSAATMVSGGDDNR